MYVFDIRDPNVGLLKVLNSLKKEGITQSTRNGPVIRFPRPVCLQYDTPQRRIVDMPLRNANPFFHLFETMWMFAGLDEIQPLLLFNSAMAQYSDDGKYLRGTAYGHRWRRKWQGDQLQTVIDKFKANPDERRVVVSMWDPYEAFKMEGKDFACNLQVIFGTRPCEDSNDRMLDMTVTNRSNDLIYGAMGSNIFHFSMLHEYMALHCGMKLGSYYQISTNLHLYLENETSKRVWEGFENSQGWTSMPASEDTSLTDLQLTFDQDTIATYVLNPDADIKDAYLTKIVKPMVEAYKIYKLKARTGIDIPGSRRIDMALSLLEDTRNIYPLHRAGAEWLERSPSRKAK